MRAEEVQVGPAEENVLGEERRQFVLDCGNGILGNLPKNVQKPAQLQRKRGKFVTTRTKKKTNES